jgi:hypothetical protein
METKQTQKREYMSCKNETKPIENLFCFIPLLYLSKSFLYRQNSHMETNSPRNTQVETVKKYSSSFLPICAAWLLLGLGARAARTHWAG